MEYPVRYINHEVADTLDSTDAFEGPEKLLELWFTPSAAATSGDDSASSRGLLDVPRSVWEPMLDLVHCKVLSVLSYNELDAYVLSESSFFVYKTRLVLKTCGTTTLLEGLPAILEIVAKYTNLNAHPARAFYSHRGFLFPEKQIAPHGTWEDEVARLKNHFPQGEAWTFGSTPRDKWYLFSSTGRRSDLPPRKSSSSLEMMMTDLDPAAADKFYSHREPGSLNLSRSLSPVDSLDETNSLESSVASLQSLTSSVGADPDDDDPGHLLGNIMTRATEIDEIYPTMGQVVDSFAFSPCGYSCNGVVGDDQYFTIHVTPENGFSYASFETNVPAKSFDMEHKHVIDRVLKIFKPGQMTLVVYDSQAQHSLANAVPGYHCTTEVVHDMAPNQMYYMTFVRDPALIVA